MTAVPDCARDVTWRAAGVFVLGCAVTAVLFPAPAQARQSPTTADLAGVVRDATGGVLPGVTITVTSLLTSAARIVTSGPDGRFTAAALPPGDYRVAAALSGFGTAVLPSVQLALGASRTVEIVLVVVGREELVTVEGGGAEPARTALSHVVVRDQIDGLPINGRNFISFSRLTPTVSVDRTPQQGASASSGLSFAGQRARSNNITVDGLDNNDGNIGAVRATFSQDAVQEFQVLAHSYAAEFGRASGGVVNIVTRSGGNELLGRVFAYARDDALNAREYFERFDPTGAPVVRDKAPYRRLQWGGVSGGPIRRNQTFFFASAERQVADVNNFVTIDPAALGLLQAAGFPDEGGYQGYRLRSTQALGKVDHLIGGGRRAAVRYNFASGLDENAEPFGGLVGRSRGAALDNRDHGVAGTYLAVGSRWVNEVRVLYGWRDQIVRSLDPRCDGACDLETEGGPTVEIVGVASVGRQRFTPQARAFNRVQLVDTVSLYTGPHLVKFGIDVNTQNLSRGTVPIHFGGRFIFAPLPAIPGVLPAPITALQAFALGLPAAYVQGYGSSNAEYRTSDFSIFVQDDWRLRPNLTLKAGLRYQRQAWPGFTLSAPGLGEYRFQSDSNDLAPRLAIAWDPGGRGRELVHASYGVFYENQLTGVLGIAQVIDGTTDGVRTLVARFPASIAAWQAPGRQLPEPAGAYPSLAVSVEPNADTPFAHHLSAGVSRSVGRNVRGSATLLYARGFNQLGTLDYNPIVPALGAGRRPLDIGGAAGTSASVLQYTGFGETWYRGLVFEMERRFADRWQLLASYTWSKAEDTSSDFQSVFLPESLGQGRNPEDLEGLPIGFDPLRERGPSYQDQRHRFVASGLWLAPGNVHVSAIVNIASGAPYNILAGADLNGDGDGGAFPSDRARRVPADPASSISRHAGRLAPDATVDVRVSKRLRLGPRGHIELLAEVFNLFNRDNLVEVNNIFGTGAYPDAPLPTFGQPTVAGPPRQMQVGLRVGF
ncbi:MAG TPA: TonB-dependent receptor [Vicinamibacterales bacterium]|nr:TonB-dependent receptor [Vicinamibacterales bacterium]